jgi:hypothetical protein
MPSHGRCCCFASFNGSVVVMREDAGRCFRHDQAAGAAAAVPVIDKSKREDGTFSREDFTFYKEGNVLSARRSTFSPRPARSSTTTSRSTEPANPIAMRAPSRRDAVRRSRRARSCAASMRRPATWRVQLPRPRPSSDHAVSANASRCCSPTSSASCDSADCDCADRAEPSSSSRSPPSLRTCAGSLSSWHDRRPRSPSALRKRQVALKLCGGRWYQSVTATAPAGASGNKGAASTLYEALRRSRWGLLQRNRPNADLVHAGSAHQIIGVKQTCLAATLSLTQFNCCPTHLFQARTHLARPCGAAMSCECKHGSSLSVPGEGVRFQALSHHTNN